MNRLTQGPACLYTWSPEPATTSAKLLLNRRKRKWKEIWNNPDKETITNLEFWNYELRHLTTMKLVHDLHHRAGKWKPIQTPVHRLETPWKREITAPQDICTDQNIISSNIWCLLSHTCIYLVCNKYSSDTMRGKCRIVRLKISITGYGNVIWLAGTEISVSTQRLHLLTACENRPRMLFQNINAHVPHYTQCPDRDRIMNLHHCKHLKSCTKEY